MDNPNGEPDNAIPIEASMSAILATMTAILVGLHSIQLPSESRKTSPTTGEKSILSSFPLQLPDPYTEPSKYCYEIFCWKYTVVWITLFGFIVVSQCYEYFTAWTYLCVCGGLALPLVLQPLIYPRASSPRAGSSNNVKDDIIVNPDTLRPLHQRYATKCTLYLLTYSFIGNYWYTHYFYSVLKAQYTMPSHRLNDVPIAMYLATHFYFTTYHVCVGNGFLRFVDQYYGDEGEKRGWRKQLLFWYTIFFLSYFTAFMETLTISSFPYYSFEDRTLAYTCGSAFYGIYFLVSFPGFYYLDWHVDKEGMNRARTQGKHDHTQQQQSPCMPMSLMDTFVTSCGHGMIILTLLDFVRLYLKIPLVIGGVAFAATE